MIKANIKSGFLCTVSVLLALYMSMVSCSDFFDTDPDTILKDEDYIKTQNEMYYGYLGIISALQNVADHAIYLTDTRADLLEPTVNASTELWDVYNYEDLSNNPYADPTKYYTLIIACNDFIYKMKEYKDRVQDSMDEQGEVDFEALMAGAIRIKAWTYFALARIYGEAYYFDDPLTKIIDLQDGSTFVYLTNYKYIVNKCIEILDSVDHLEIDWGAWLDPEDPTNSEYALWQFITPNYKCLRSELCLARGAEGDYEWVKEAMMSMLYAEFNTSNRRWRMGNMTVNTYPRFFSRNSFTEYIPVSTVFYDYEKNQTNGLINCFSEVDGAEYLLKPSVYGREKFDESGSGSLRTTTFFRNDDDHFSKFTGDRGGRTAVYQSDPPIQLYSSFDLHYMLAEALNHLGNWRECETILNRGLSSVFASNTIDRTLGWDDPRWDVWIGRNFSPDGGIRGCLGVDPVELPMPTDPVYRITEEERQKIYDLALLDDMLMEFAGEGRAYGMMVRMAERYNDPAIIGDRVAPKYPIYEQGDIRTKIMSGEYFVKYDLSNMSGE